MDEPGPAAGRVLGLIKARFAGAEPIIEYGYLHAPSFRSLCQDYQECVATLECLGRQDAGGATALRQEYMELQEELGGEIRHWLAAHKSG